MALSSLSPRRARTFPPFCPHCGFHLTGSGSRPEIRLLERYFGNLKNLILDPKRFFRTTAQGRGLTEPVAFALLTHWIAKAISYLWGLWLWNGRSSSSMMNQLVGSLGGLHGSSINVLGHGAKWLQARESLTSWMLGIGSVIADPFYTMIVIFFSAIFLFIGARILVSANRQSEVTYESAVKILAFMTSAQILSVVPFVGTFIAAIYAVYVGIVGAREFYGVGALRALVILFFPQVLAMGLFVILVLMALVLVAGLAFVFVH